MVKFLLILFFLLSNTCGFGQSKSESLDAGESKKLTEIEKSSLEEDLLLDFELTRTENFKFGVKIINQTSIDSMSSISTQVNDLLPESFSNKYIQFKNEGYTAEGLELLYEAESLTTNSAELYSDFLATAHILKKSPVLDEYSTKLRNSGFITATVLEYNKNILRSVSENNAFIVTNGWEDTYPLLTLLKEERKKNVQVINVEWLYDSNFRERLSDLMGVSNSGFANNPYSWINTQIEKSNKSVYYTPTLPNSELMKIQNSVTPVGILFKSGAMTTKEQSMLSLKAWNKFSKVKMISTEPITKNYIVLLTLLEMQLFDDESEKETLEQVTDYKEKLLLKHPSLK